MTRIPASPAPAETPMIPGEASGLRMMLCRIVPAAARQAPVRAPSRIRGRRMLMIICVSIPSGRSHSRRRISAAVSFSAPKRRLSTMAAPSSAAATMQKQLLPAAL